MSNRKLIDDLRGFECSDAVGHGDFELCQIAADALEKQEWQTIETAPKDGTMFICWVSAERWSQEDGGGSGMGADTSDVDFCQWRDNNGNGYYMNMMGQIGDAQEVTHWMPIPAPPSTA